MADYSDSFDPAHEQEQELLVVQSIFMDEFKRLPDEPASGGHGICKVVQLTILPCPNEPDANHCVEHQQDTSSWAKQDGNVPRFDQGAERRGHIHSE